MPTKAAPPAIREHAFAPFVRTLGRGRAAGRSLDTDEAAAAFGMILDGHTTPAQLGAFLMLLRVKEETGAELAGFTRAARARLLRPAQPIEVDLDWPSYAGKRRHHPWYLLAALLLAAHGIRVLMHACEPHAADRLFSTVALAELGIVPATDWDAASASLRRRNFACVPLAVMSPRLQQLLDLRREFGLRSPVNTFVRHLDPCGAHACLQSVHHPAYAALHLEAARLLGQSTVAVFRGEGGECELRPDAANNLLLLRGEHVGEVQVERQHAVRAEKPEQPSTAPLRALWDGMRADTYGELAVQETAAAALLALGRATDFGDARASAARMWLQRPAWQDAFGP